LLYYLKLYFAYSPSEKTSIVQSTATIEHFIRRSLQLMPFYTDVFIWLTIGSSTLSHDFYQVIVDSQSMSLHGWGVLAEWSIEHSCMTNAEKSEVKRKWFDSWNVFCQWIVDEYGAKYSATRPSPKPKLRSHTRVRLLVFKVFKSRNF
jgi:hypothetical protein